MSAFEFWGLWISIGLMFAVLSLTIFVFFGSNNDKK